MTVGFFDSGIGGISVLEKAADQCPTLDLLFYADLDHVPYGTKTREEIVGYVDAAVRFLHEQGADIIVLACNTATSAAAKFLREKYVFPILGMEPAVKVASGLIENPDEDKIFVTATDLTLKLEKLDHLIRALNIDKNVDEISLQGLVGFAEQGTFDGEAVKEYTEQALATGNLDKVKAVVLGCTHFTFYKTLIKNIMLNLTGRDIPVIDGNQGTVNYLATYLPEATGDRKELSERIRFFESGREAAFEKYRPLLARAHKENAGGQ
ncbi:MAG: glutamate racemase [Peptococcaceae bacterium]|nr:glutamate racemase [Peptococcaceae bacterium]